MKTIRVAITDFVGFFCRKGHIVSGFMAQSSAMEGTLIHQMIQKSHQDDYQSEVTLSITHTFDDVSLTLSGRMDGLCCEESAWWVEEIKSTATDFEFLEEDAVHLAQAKLYAYIYALQNKLSEIHVKMTYVHIETKQQQHFMHDYSFLDLQEFFDDLMTRFYSFYTTVHQSKILRDQSLQAMKFPYDSFRQGQKEMAVACFKAIKNREVLFIQAATGIGKTLSTLYPAIQSLGRSTSKIMYLTAKTIARQVAKDTLDLLKSQGLYLTYVMITAKEKICFMDESRCHPDLCPFAKNHYDRVNDALFDIISHETNFTREIIEQYARKHQICPFEFSLDLYNFADVSISDYNYAFDPKVNLKRAFEESNDYTLLVDEAHNLVDRSRQMYSATISLEILEHTKKVFKPKKGKWYQQFKKIFEIIQDLDEQPSFIQKEAPHELVSLIERFLETSRVHLPKLQESLMKDQLTECFFMLNDVSRIYDFYDDHFITYYDQEMHALKLFCLDASQCLRPIYQKCHAVILFSATLLPISYFFHLLGGKEGDKRFYYASPFPRDHLLLLAANDIEATYRHRSFYYQDIVNYLEVLISKKQGHYLVFFPSYAYMNEVASLIKNYDLYIQNTNMTEIEREQFLNAFQTEPEKTKLFFCVLGGIFSEGIDLKADQVIGVVIVSVGLPQICLERELIKEHFSQENLGYHYAYVYPGFNKVLQAAGRLIRTMDDRGVVLLLDERYLKKDYSSLFPKEWHHAKVTQIDMISNQLDTFYHDLKNK